MGAVGDGSVGRHYDWTAVGARCCLCSAQLMLDVRYPLQVAMRSLSTRRAMH